MLDSAIANFDTRDHRSGTANGTAAACALANLARVGLARAQLQAGRNAAGHRRGAVACRPASRSACTYVDDSGNRTRLGNRLWQFTLDRGSISVAAAFR